MGWAPKRSTSRSTTADSNGLAGLGQAVAARARLSVGRCDVDHRSSGRDRRPTCGDRTCAGIRSTARGGAGAGGWPLGRGTLGARMTGRTRDLARTRRLRGAPGGATPPGRRRDGHAAVQPRRAPARVADRARPRPSRARQRDPPRVHRRGRGRHRDRHVRRRPRPSRAARPCASDARGEPTRRAAGARGPRGRAAATCSWRGRSVRSGSRAARATAPRPTRSSARRASRSRACSKAASTSSSSRPRAISSTSSHRSTAVRQLCDLPVVASVTFDEDLGAADGSSSRADGAAALRRGGRRRARASTAGRARARPSTRSVRMAAAAGDSTAADHAQRRAAQPRRGHVRLRGGAGLLRRGGRRTSCEAARASSAAAAGRRPSTSRRCARHSTARRARDRGDQEVASGRRPRPRRASPRGRGGSRRQPAPTPRPCDAADGPTDAPTPSGLAQALAAGRFVISVEIDPPRIGAPRADRRGGAPHQGEPAPTSSTSATARWRASAWARWRSAFAMSRDPGLECLVHVTTRDRNLMALESELLGAHALGIRDILALTGDPPASRRLPGRHGHLGHRLDGPHRHPQPAGARRGRGRAGRSARRRRSRSPARSTRRRPTSTASSSGWRASSRPAPTLIMTQPIYAPEQWQPLHGPGRGALRRPAAAAGAARGAAAAHRRATPSSSTTRCPASPSPTASAPRCGTPASAARSSGSSCRSSCSASMLPHVDGTYVMPSFGRYELAAELVRRDPARARSTRRGPSRLTTSPAGPPARVPTAAGAAPPAPAGRRSMTRRDAAGVATRRCRQGACAALVMARRRCSSCRCPRRAAEAPRFAERARGQHILDDARLIDDADEQRLPAELQELLAETGVDLVVYTRRAAAGRLARRGPRAGHASSSPNGRSVARTGSARRCCGTSTRRATRHGSASPLGDELALRLDGANGLVTAVTQRSARRSGSEEWDTRGRPTASAS